ncbi:ATP-binding protein [Cryptosporangium sp. NPDC051539]|uniref:ATP-binding protein n=1 Tax=Cryptosporangium sp. NPDC051539 TaxID=3363962 RepID=UPI0037A86356
MNDSTSALRVQVLGPLRLWRDGRELKGGPRLQARILGLLSLSADAPVSLPTLIELVWGDEAPTTAVNVVQKHVGALRRLFEPSLPARGAGSYLHRHADGYRFAATPDTLDLLAFRKHLDEARAAVAQGDHDAALDSYSNALGLWRGPVGDGLDYGPAATPLLAARNGEFFDACVTAAQLAAPRGRSGRLLPALRLAASLAPRDESVQAAFTTALASVGRSDEAAPRRAPVPVGATTATRADVGADALVGRTDDLRIARRSVEAALAGGTGLVLVDGEPGVGKTRLLEEVAGEATARGALVVWGRCLDGDGTPVMWPWTQSVTALLESLPAASRSTWSQSELGSLVQPREGRSAPDAGAQFRLFEQVVAIIGQVAGRRPVVLVFDDLQWADAASLHLLGHLTARMPDGAALIGAFRDRAPVPGSDLTRFLAAANSVPHHRHIDLGPLSPDEVTELVRRETGTRPDAGVTRTIYDRTAGNPFFVRELARLLADGAGAGAGPTAAASTAAAPTAAARARVPSTVHDVVRDRMRDLDEGTTELLRIAAIIGRDAELRVLTRAADVDAEAGLERLAPAEALGLLAPARGDVLVVRFAHDLVREAVVDAMPPQRVLRYHLRVAEALEPDVTHGASDVERLAHHFWAAGPLADPARTASALLGAADRAAGKFAFEAAEQHLRSAVQLARGADLPELELSALSQLAMVVETRSGFVAPTLELMTRAEQVARRLGREREATKFLYFRFLAHAQDIRIERNEPLARRLRERGETSRDPIVRVFGLHAWGIHQWQRGFVGEGNRYFRRCDRALADGAPPDDDDGFWPYLAVRIPLWLALSTTANGDVDGGQKLLREVEAEAEGDPNALTVWSGFSAIAAAWAGDADRALRAARRGIAVDPEHSRVHLGAHERLAECWALAVSGDASAAAEAAKEGERIVLANLADPAHSCVAGWYGLLGEAWLAAERPDRAAAALDRADQLQDAHGERCAEGLILLVRARLVQARGEPLGVVRAAAERAREVSVRGEAHLFARRADEMLAGLGAVGQ